MMEELNVAMLEALDTTTCLSVYEKERIRKILEKKS